MREMINSTPSIGPLSQLSITLYGLGIAAAGTLIAITLAAAWVMFTR
ncbi:hypothetical protein AGMMS4952_11400 [Spirochaetia bacterium]|nr:hypothetical protein AGMMS4952_11400 [Spirochaetia bacterium]